MCAEAGRIPRAGDQIPFAQYMFTVLQVEDNRLILSVSAKLLDHGNDRGSTAARELGNTSNDVIEAFYGVAWEPDGDSDQDDVHFEGSTLPNGAYRGNINGNGNPNALRMGGDVVSSSVYDRATFPDMVSATGADVDANDMYGANAVCDDISGASGSASTITSSLQGAVRGKRVFVEGTWMEDWFNNDD